MSEAQKLPETQQKKPSQLHKAIINEWFANGYNKAKAVQAIKPNISYHTARSTATAIFKLDVNRSYIKAVQERAESEAAITNAQVLKELINFAYSDITDYLDLSLKELKELPPDVRRCIAQVQHKKKNYVNRAGDYVNEETYTIKLVDKVKAIDMINKHLGFYSEDNKQKKPTVNLNNVTVEQLNVLLSIAESGALTIEQ